ncbi:hypothetical protein KPL78_00730 [Roseomonas sp. HJA6]|uniref:Uncharacterized protein n=1 Tax=Roseomonas alba TaxID=2846776 RepID=A0ABS7A2N1_9PROT|nr:hypothetical protein [Neoroseomonas alba]MBW6396345.1 hypothetical protein [Neoroseomonas alba]
MTALLILLGAVALIGMAVLAITAIAAGIRAVRIGGKRLLFNGMAWIVPPADLPPAARPHLHRALSRWIGAMGCLLLAGIAFGLGGVLS